MESLISVIVPVYNSALYVRECVKSVLAQTYSCFEVLLIDDGSGDGSREICENLCREDERVQLICRPHKGVSASRNAGIRAAQGKYVFFLDSDDAIHCQLLEALFELLEKNKAVIGTESFYYADDGDFQKPVSWNIESDYIQTSDYLKNEKVMEYDTFISKEAALDGIGGKLILRERIGDLCFDETLINGEDTLFLYQLIINGADVCVLNHDWYYYRIHEGGANQVFTVPSCKSRYQVLTYIRDQEKKNERLINAVCWEANLLDHMMQWYRIGKEKKDFSLMKYVARLADIEKRETILEGVNQKKQEQFRQMIESLISVIIPVYNSAFYVQECVKSVLAQTYSYFEVLLIDDGSEDDSREICESLCREDERVHLICRPHKGVSAARNAGIMLAKGKYVFFLDSDDAIHPQLLEALYQLQEKNRTAVAKVNLNFIKHEQFKDIDRELAKDFIQHSRYLDSKKTKTYMWGIGGKLILREKIGTVRFDEKIKNAEDTLFLYQLCPSGMDVSVLNYKWYYYRVYNESASGSCSTELCENTYQVLRYICNQELKENRLSNAAYWENAILRKLIIWDEDAKEKHDRSLLKYIKNLAELEKKSGAISIADTDRKVAVYLILYCHPVLPIFKAIGLEPIRQKKIWMKWRVKSGIAWVKKEQTWIKWRVKRAVAWMKRQVKQKKEWLSQKTEQGAVWLIWRVKRAIAWVKRKTKQSIKETWEKSWRIRNKVYWAGVLLKRILRILSGKRDDRGL